MNLSKFIHTTTGGYLSSVILGIGLSCLFRKLCKNGDCIIYKAPPSTDILGNIFEYNDKCYVFEAVPTTFDKTKQVVEFA
jgi:hypothetical protein